MKRLISLISTHGKSPQQSTQEVWQAFQKYQKVEAQVLQKMSQTKPQARSQPQPPPKEESESSSLSQRFLIPLNLSAGEALRAVKAHFQIAKK